MKKIKFLHITLIFFALAFISVYVLSLFGFAKIENERVVRFVSIGVFFVAALAVALNETKNYKFSFAKIFKTNLLVTITFSALLVFSISTQNIGIYASGVFVGAAAFTLLCNGKIFKPSWCYYFLFFYAIFLMFGTIGTTKGVHFPEMTYSFYLLPISFIAFQFSKETLEKITRFFFRAMFIYLIISVLYWWFNFLYLDINFADWVTKKTHFSLHIADWHYQNKLYYALYPAFCFVSSWSYYFHPSFNALVLFCALISGFYLFFKSKINKFELLFFVFIMIFFQILTQSRVGLIGTFFILIISVFYYFGSLRHSCESRNRLKFKRLLVKPAMTRNILLICLLLGSCIFLFFNKNIQNYLHDDVRKTDYTLAINYIQDHIFWGCSYHQQTTALREQEEIMKDVLPKVYNGKYYVHNQLLGDMVQFGIWGGIALLILLFGIILYAIKKRSYPLLMFILTMILFMQIEEPLYGQTGITRFSVFFVYFVALAQSKEKINYFDLYGWLCKKWDWKIQKGNF